MPMIAYKMVTILPMSVEEYHITFNITEWHGFTCSRGNIAIAYGGYHYDRVQKCPREGPLRVGTGHFLLSCGEKVEWITMELNRVARPLTIVSFVSDSVDECFLELLHDHFGVVRPIDHVQNCRLVGHVRQLAHRVRSQLDHLYRQLLLMIVLQ